MKFDDLKKLHQKKYREEFGYFLVEGEHLVLELEKASQQFPELKKSDVYVTEKNNHFSTSLKKIVINEKQMAQLSETKSPQGVIACAPIHFQTPSASRQKKAIYLHEIQDPGNLGTILRSIAWFNDYKLLLSPNSVDPFNAKVLRASMGAIFHISIEENIEPYNLINRYKNFAALTMQGNSTHEPSFKNFDCYLFGNEARGLPDEIIKDLNASAYTIEGSGNIDSLNLASAVGMTLYELFRQ